MFSMVGLFNFSVPNAESNMTMYFWILVASDSYCVYAKIIKGVSREPFRQNLLENLSAIIVLDG